MLASPLKASVALNLMAVLLYILCLMGLWVSLIFGGDKSISQLYEIGKDKLPALSVALKFKDVFPSAKFFKSIFELQVL